MSFTQEVKTNICNNELLTCCQRAELAAMVQLCAVLSITKQQLSLKIKTQNPTVAKRALFLLKKLYKVETQLSMIRQTTFKKRHVYEIEVLSQAKFILEDLTLLSPTGLSHHPAAAVVRKKCCGRAFIAGAFLAGGSVNSPTSSNYHLEISCGETELADFIIKLLARHDIVAKTIFRRQKPLIYFKQSEKISDFLRLVGAFESLLKYEDARIQRDYVNNMYRLDNCDIANEMKAQQSATKQYEDVKLLAERLGIENLEPRLAEVAQLRLDYTDVSLLELSELYEKRFHQPISKSGIRHRLNKIKEIALRYKD